MSRHLWVVVASVKDGQDVIRNDISRRYALEHACELLAEASKHCSREFRALNPDLPWDALRRLRSAVAHPYDVRASNIQLERLWRFGVDEGPKLRRQLEHARFPR
jgi:uncharacterized protein with HEPN domain